MRYLVRWGLVLKYAGLLAWDAVLGLGGTWLVLSTSMFSLGCVELGLSVCGVLTRGHVYRVGCTLVSLVYTCFFVVLLFMLLLLVDD